MVDKSIIKLVRRYLRVLNDNGIPTNRAILFGSQARGDAGPDSDIDILVLSEEFDKNLNGRFSAKRQNLIDKMWKLTIKVEYSLQPFPVGNRQFIDDDVSPVIEMARREGIEIKRN